MTTPHWNYYFPIVYEYLIYLHPHQTLLVVVYGEWVLKNEPRSYPPGGVQKYHRLNFQPPAAHIWWRNGVYNPQNLRQNVLENAPDKEKGLSDFSDNSEKIFPSSPSGEGSKSVMPKITGTGGFTASP